MITVTSTFAGTPIVPANAHGPYVVPGGTEVQLDAGPPDPSATYEWDLGDGTTANTPSVTHAYGDDGVYIAKLTVIVTTPGGARTRDFAEIVVTNVTPMVALSGPDVFDEGESVAFAGTFSDAEWLDHHTASWIWGDPSLPEPGTLSETHDPPACTGTVAGSHAWGDSGTYRVKLLVRDEDGAVGQTAKQVTVRNVAPTVSTPHMVYATPCTVVTLQAEFTDPGWLDRHVAVWHFGDAHCTAIIREQNLPPIGRGSATASHIYHDLGSYNARCIVTDDDGASGFGDTIVHVVNVRNRHFEEGFRLRLVGEVANDWEPYSIPTQPIGPDQPPPPGRPVAAPFSAQETLFHRGEYAQRIRPAAGQRAGLWQRIGANLGWEYLVTAWYSLAERADEPGTTSFDPEDMGTWARPDSARLGVDPFGGSDPTSSAIVWTRGGNRLDWRHLAVSARTQADAITIFLEAFGGDLVGADACFDDVALVPTCRVLAPPKTVEQCCSFENVLLGRVLVPFLQDGFTFRATDLQVFEIVTIGDAAATHKLVLPPQRLAILLPLAAEFVIATVATLRENTSVVMEALDSNGSVLAMTTATPPIGTNTLSVAAPSIHSVAISPGEGVALLVRICASQGPRTAS
jgi:PKD repeat protein